MNSNPRQAEYDIAPQFLQRWSPRSFRQQDIPDKVLFSLFEAARWAPSGNNLQPWRFILARSAEDRNLFLTFINEGNRKWCRHAPALALVISEQSTEDGKTIGSHAFDAGAAWGYLALEGIRQGLVTHAMGGFDKDKARQVLSIPDRYALHAVIAIGYQGDKDQLPQELQEREQPSPRRPVHESVYEGTFTHKTDS